MVLIDTSVWRRHFRSNDPRLVDLLLSARAVTHAWVVGELLLGSGLPRIHAASIARMPLLPTAADVDVLPFIERSALARSGLGMVDTHLLLAALSAGADLYTHDEALGRAFARLAPATGRSG